MSDKEDAKASEGSKAENAPGTTEQSEAERANELQRKQEEAQEQLEALLRSNKPKNLGQGLSRGAGNILGGALGAAGIVVLAPTAGLAVGAKEGGILGGVVGLTGGAIVGVLGGAAVAVAGVASGVGQIVRGIMAVPASITEPRKGKWWDENEGKWVETDLTKEKAMLESVPEDNSDILGNLTDVPEKGSELSEGAVKETGYYDALELDPKADASAIKKKYYILARKYHPDKVGKDDKEAAEKFKDVAEAYQVLSDPDLRKVYDREGKEGLSGDKTSIAVTGAQIDPELLYAFLFGSHKFAPYVGTLGMAASASIGDTKKVSWKDARTLQKRRVARLALLLVDRIHAYVSGDIQGATAGWKKEANELASASYGYEMLILVGQAYSLTAAQFLGSFDSGVGMPSIAEWAKSNLAKLESQKANNKQKKQGMFAGLSMMQMQLKHAQELQKATSEEAKQKLNEDFQKELTSTMLEVMWTTTAVDVTNTLFEVCQMVFFDKSVEKHVRKSRGKAVKALGDVFMAVPKPADQEGMEMAAEEVYRAAAEAAMLETIKRKEESAFKNSFRVSRKSFRQPKA